MVRFEQLNEVYSQISCEDGLLFELVDEFAKLVPNYMYNPLWKAKKWDGKIRFISKNGIFYNGLLKDVWLSCKRRGYNEFSFSGYTKTSDYTEESILARLESFLLPYNLYEEQLTAIIESLTKKKRLCISPTSSGKSLIIYCIARILAEDGYRILIQVPSVALVNQMESDFISYSKDDTFSVSDMCHKIYAGEEKFSNKPIIISTWQSIDAMSIKVKKKVVDNEKQKSFMESFDVVMSDEVHKCDATVVKTIMEKAINACYRIGFTGTLKEADKTLPDTLIGLYGKPFRVTTTKELMDTGKVTKLKIVPLVLNYPTEMCKLVSRMDYHQELDTITGHAPRNEFIANLIKKLDGNCIVLLRYIDKHAKPLKEIIETMTGKKVILMDKDTPVDERESIRKSMETESNVVIIGTYALISTGISIKNLPYLIFAAPLKSRIAVLQSIGRILRLNIGKNLAVAFDIVDNLSYKGKQNFLMDHFTSRFDIYTTEQFEMTIKEYTIE